MPTRAHRRRSRSQASLSCCDAVAARPRASCGIVAGVRCGSSPDGGGPADRVRQAGQADRPDGDARSRRERPGRLPDSLDVALEQDGANVPLFSWPVNEAPRSDARTAGRASPDRAIGKHPSRAQAGPARIVVTATRPVLFGMREASASASQRLPGPPRRRRASRRLDAPLHQPRRRGDGRLPCEAGRRASPACASATSSIRASPPRAPASRRRPGAAGRVLCAAATIRTCTTPITVFARDEAGNAARADFDDRRVPEAVPQEPHRARRQVHGAGRAGDPRQHSPELKVDDAERPADVVPGDQPRPAQAERRDDRGARGARRRPRCCGRAPFHQFVNSAVEVELRRSPHLPL